MSATAERYELWCPSNASCFGSCSVSDSKAVVDHVARRYSDAVIMCVYLLCLSVSTGWVGDGGRSQTGGGECWRLVAGHLSAVSHASSRESGDLTPASRSQRSVKVSGPPSVYAANLRLGFRISFSRIRLSLSGGVVNDTYVEYSPYRYRYRVGYTEPVTLVYKCPYRCVLHILTCFLISCFTHVSSSFPFIYQVDIRNLNYSKSQ